MVSYGSKLWTDILVDALRVPAVPVNDFGDKFVLV